MTTVACVLRSGGRYSEVDVLRLLKHLRHEVLDFVCLSDLPLASVRVIPLARRGLAGWWSKIELFSALKGPTVYFDLDTVLVGSIRPLLDLAEHCGQRDFYMLAPINPHRETHCSGVMVWNGDWGMLSAGFEDHFVRRYRKGDQEYISARLGSMAGVNLMYLQDRVDGIYSYKKSCAGGLPPDARVVCFHGRPSPADCAHLGWVKEHWL